MAVDAVRFQENFKRFGGRNRCDARMNQQASQDRSIDDSHSFHVEEIDSEKHSEIQTASRLQFFQLFQQRMSLDCSWGYRAVNDDGDCTRRCFMKASGFLSRSPDPPDSQPNRESGRRLLCVRKAALYSVYEIDPLLSTMPNEKTKKLIGTNAGILTIATLVSFILPLILDSMLEGRGNFIKAMSHVMPLFASIPLSCRLIVLAGTQSDVPTESK